MFEQSDFIKIFDEDAKPLQNFENSPVASKAVAVNWPSIKLKLKLPSEYIQLDSGTDKDDTKISKLPSIFRGFAREKIGSNSYSRLEEQSTYRLNALDVTPDGRYIVLHNRKGSYIALQTKNEAGILLSPRNWTRIDPSSYNKDTFPSDLEKFADGLEIADGYVPLNEKYSALITDIGLNIVRTETPKGVPVFSVNTPSIGRNIVVDSTNPNAIYYCPGSNPREMMRLDLSDEPNKWAPVAAEFSERYDSVTDFQLDPSGNFFLFHSKDDLVIVTKDTLDEVKRVPGLTQANFDSQGNIRAVDKNGHLVIYEPQFQDLAQEMDKRRIARLAEGINLTNIFDVARAKKAETAMTAETLEHLVPLRAQYEAQFKEVLATITTQGGVQQLRQGFNNLRDALRQQGLKPNEVGYILEGLNAPIQEKEKEFAAHGAQEALTLVRSRLQTGLSISSVSEAKTALDGLKATEGLLNEQLRSDVRQVAQELETQSLELFRQRGGEVIKDVQGLVSRTRTDLEGFTTKAQMDDWLEFRYPQLMSRLGSLARDTPMEADEAYKTIVAARAELQTVATEFEEKFKVEYARVREKAAERTESTIDTLEQDVHGVVERLRARGFTDRSAAEQYLESSEARKVLEAEIAALATDNPDAAKELQRALKVRISNTLTEIERGTLMRVAETGQQMILFGNTAFPKWEAKVAEKGEQAVDVIFAEDAKSRGPGIRAGDILGDVAITISTPGGEQQTVRLYEGLRDEQDWRLGLLNYRGTAISPSYVSATEYRKIKADYTTWAQGENSSLQKEFGEKRTALVELYAKREKPGQRTDADAAWQAEYRGKLQEYATFVSEHHIPLLRRIDRVKGEPEIEYTNGKGFVPEWQSHWVMDRQTEKDLENMATTMKMQLDLQEGMLNLIGHAGTGKDVRLKMFCSLSNRPYFAIDGTKWTTEFELSEDVVLESKEGASQTVKVPSAVLNGITTPGAVVYFNEFNAMPEQAQIFLHALMDEKRSLTLKTSSGKVVRALPSVLLASSMNPGYPGTFEPQLATRSRMVSLEIGYPPLTRTADAGDTNPNPPYDASEALRIARGVDSLADLTYEASLERNDFVKMWDKYINGIQNDAPNPSGPQKFDIDTTLALVQFASNLRGDFIKVFEKTREARNALPVSQPITGRELRRCAYAISKMTPAEKATANPEAVARDLLNTYFLTHIDKQDDRNKIRTAMNTWTSRKRVGA